MSTNTRPTDFIGEYRDELVWRAENAARFRARKAAQYPDDIRNARSNKALHKLASSLQTVRLENPILKECCEIEYTPRDVDAEETDRLRDAQNETFARYGFHSAGVPSDGDAVRFLESLRDALCFALTLVA